jgi:hypothetical protein
MHHAIYGARLEPWPEPIDGRSQISALTGRQCPVDILRDGPERSLRCAQDRPGPKELPSTGPGRCQRLQRESRRHRSYLSVSGDRRSAGADDRARGSRCRPGAQGASTHAAPRLRLRAGLLGHRSITSTAVYTALAPNRFRDFWGIRDGAATRGPRPEAPQVVYAVSMELAHFGFTSGAARIVICRGNSVK